MDDRRLSDYEPGAIEHAIVTAGCEWADKRHAAMLLAETLKPLRAKLFLEAQGKSVAEREHMALAHPDYTAHVKLMADADREEIKAKVRFEAKKAKLDAMRTLESTRRAELTALR